MTEEEHDQRKQHRLDTGSKVVLLLVGGLFLMVASGLVVSLLSNGNSAASRAQGDEQACMSIWNGRKEAAANEVDRAEDRRDDLYLQAQVSAAVGDTAALQGIVAQAPQVLADLIAVRDRRDVAQRAYTAAGLLRKSNPERFLAECPDR